MRRTLLVLLLVGAMLPLVPTVAADTPPVVTGYIMPGSPPQMVQDRGETFQIRVSVEDDVEVVAVSAEFIHVASAESFILVFPESSKNVVGTGPEQSQWTLEVPVDKPELLSGEYEVFIRVHDNKNNYISFPPEDEGLTLEIEYEDEDPAILPPLPITQAGYYKMEVVGVPEKGIPVEAHDGKPDVVYPGGASCPDDKTVKLRSGERLRVNTSLDDVFIHDMTWAAFYRFAANEDGEIESPHDTFTDPERLLRPYDVGMEGLIPDWVVGQGPVEMDLEVLFQMVPRMTDYKPLSIHLDCVVVDTLPPRLPEGGITGSEDFTVFRDVPFELWMVSEDRLEHTVQVVIPGKAPGGQVVATDPDVGAALTRIQAGLGYRDLDASGSFTAGDTLYLDTDGSRFISAGDVELTGVRAGHIVRATDPMLADPLVVPPGGFTDAYRDVDGSGTYTRGDVVYLDDPTATGKGIGVTSGGDVRLSGSNMGRITVEGRDAPVDLEPGALGRFAFVDADVDGVLDPDETLYYAAGSAVAANDVRVANPAERVSEALVGEAATETEHSFMLTLSELGLQTIQVRVRDELGNTEAFPLPVQVVDPIATVRIQDIKVLNKTVFPRDRIHFEASINQTEGIVPVPVDVDFRADGVTQTAGALLPVGTSRLVEYNNTYRPGRHTMNVTVHLPAGVESLNGSRLTMEVPFEVFMGAVDDGDMRFYIRANAVGYPGSAVFDPGPEEKVYDLTPQAAGSRSYWAFNAGGKTYTWDLTTRNAAGEPVTEYKEPVAEEPPKDSPAAAVGVLVVTLLGAALARRRR